MRKLCWIYARSFLIEIIAAGRCFNIKPGASTEKREAATAEYILINLNEILLVLVNIILSTGRLYIYHMVRNLAVFAEILARADVHTSVPLPRVGGNDFNQRSAHKSIDTARELHCISGLPGRSRAEDAHKIDDAIAIAADYGLNINFFRLRQFGRKRYPQFRHSNILPQLRSSSRRISFSLMDCRLSYSFFPLARAIFSFA